MGVCASSYTWIFSGIPTPTPPERSVQTKLNYIRTYGSAAHLEIILEANLQLDQGSLASFQSNEANHHIENRIDKPLSL